MLQNLNSVQTGKKFGKEQDVIDFIMMELVWPTIKVMETDDIDNEDWKEISSTRLLSKWSPLYCFFKRKGITLTYTQVVDEVLDKRTNHSSILNKCRKYSIKPTILQQLYVDFNVSTVEEVLYNVEKKYVSTETSSLSNYHTTDKSPHGRLYTTGLTLQNCSSKLRKEILRGQFEYDIESAHIALLQNYASQCGYNSPVLDELIWRKKDLRKMWAEECNVSEDAIKKLTIAMTYGAQNRVGDKMTAIGSYLPKKECQERFIELFAPYKKVLDEAKTVVLTSLSDDADMKLVNEMDGSDSSKLSHFLQMKEVKVLFIMIECVIKFSVLQHDGLTSTAEKDAEEIMDTIQERLKLHLLISAKKL